MHAQLEAVVGQLERARDHLRAVAAKTSADRWTTRAEPDRWSVGECVVHLNLTSQAYIPLIRDALGAGIGRVDERPYARSAMGFLLAYAVGPMPKALRRRMRFKTAAAFVPQGDAPRDAAVAEFERMQAELIALTRACDGLAIDRVRIQSPFDARARYDIYSALTIIPRHQERHLVQADEVWSGR